MQTNDALPANRTLDILLQDPGDLSHAERYQIVCKRVGEEDARRLFGDIKKADKNDPSWAATAQCLVCSNEETTPQFYTSCRCLYVLLHQSCIEEWWRRSHKATCIQCNQSCFLIRLAWLKTDRVERGLAKSAQNVRRSQAKKTQQATVRKKEKLKTRFHPYLDHRPSTEHVPLFVLGAANQGATTSAAPLSSRASYGASSSHRASAFSSATSVSTVIDLMESDDETPSLPPAQLPPAAGNPHVPSTARRQRYTLPHHAFGIVPASGSRGRASASSSATSLPTFIDLTGSDTETPSLQPDQLPPAAGNPYVPSISRRQGHTLPHPAFGIVSASGSRGRGSGSLTLRSRGRGSGLGVQEVVRRWPRLDSDND